MSELVPLQRCCASHTGWPQLTQHLVESFPEISIVEILGIVNRTRRAQSDFGLPEDQQLETAEIIVRHQLMQLAGLDGPPARLDSQSHTGRARPTADPT